MRKFRHLIIPLVLLFGSLPSASGQEPVWEAHCQELTGKGPDGWANAGGWRPISFFEHNRPILDWGPVLSWQPVDATVTSRLVGAIKGVQFFEVLQKVGGNQTWERQNRVLLLAGPDESQLRPVHLLNSTEDIVRSIAPIEIVPVGDSLGISLRYFYTGTGGHSGWYVYVPDRGRPRDIQLQEALLGELPPKIANSWKRWESPHHRWAPPGAEERKPFDLSSLTGSEFLASKTDDRTCWFDAIYTLDAGRLKLSHLKLSDCPICDWCRD